MTDIFLSYAGADLRQAEQLADALQKVGWSVCWDRTVPPDRGIHEITQEALDAAKCVVVLWSDLSVKSRRVEMAARWALENHKLISVMLHDEVRVPLEFSNLHATSLSEWFRGSRELEFPELVSILIEMIGPPGRAASRSEGSLPIDEPQVIPSSPPRPGDEDSTLLDPFSVPESGAEYPMSGLPEPLYQQVMARALAETINGHTPYVTASGPQSSPIPQPTSKPSASGQRETWDSRQAPFPLLRVVIRYATLAGAIALTAWAGLKLFPLIFGITSQARIRRPDDSTGETHPVECSIYAPPKLAVGDAALVQVYLHPPGRADEAEAGAKLFDSDAEKRGFTSLSLDLASGTRVAIQLDVEGLEVSDDGFDEIRWNNSVVGTSFKVSSSACVSPGKHFGTVRLMVDGVPAGKIHFIMEVVDSLEVEVPPEGIGESAHHYHKAFISYASEDRTEVLKRVQTLGALKIRYFQDVLDLEPGDRWEKELYKEIDNCDLFLLFWSSAARDSEWVYQEALYARQRQIESETEEPDIIPMLIEGPPPPKPWSEFKGLHFNDKLIYLMRPHGNDGDE